MTNEEKTLQCSLMFVDCIEIKSHQNKVILSISYELVKISGDFPSITP